MSLVMLLFAAGLSCEDRYSVPAICDCDADCSLGYKCVARTCHNFHCGDKIKDGDESDVDCGGKDCPRCAAGKQCDTTADCDGTPCERTPAIWFSSSMVCTAPPDMAPPPDLEPPRDLAMPDDAAPRDGGAGD